jgi:hypothetical protein
MCIKPLVATVPVAKGSKRGDYIAMISSYRLVAMEGWSWGDRVLVHDLATSRGRCGTGMTAPQGTSRSCSG